MEWSRIQVLEPFCLGSILALPFISCVTWSKLLDCSVPLFHHLENGDKNGTYLPGLLLLNEFTKGKHLKQCLTYTQYYIYIRFVSYFS